MSAQKRETTNTRGQPHRAWEALLFLLASAVGVYGIGRGLAGFYEQGQQISLVWLAATGVAFFVLFAQMGRVHDTWPHRPGKVTPSHVTRAQASSGELAEDQSSGAGGK